VKYYLFILIGLLGVSCATVPKGSISSAPASPRYDQMNAWAAHPDKLDKADLVPQQDTPADQEPLSVDVFFVHPTTYTSKPIQDSWNAPVTHAKLNKITDGSTIQYQASIFNAAGRIYAPRYRQAHLKAYYMDDKKQAKQIFDLAYSDVRAAFKYYLEHHNDGRPFIIASHSQGTTHTSRLITEMIDGQALQDQLVAAYLIGMPIAKDIYDHVTPCQGATDTGCFVSWRTFKRGYTPEDAILGDKIAAHNPLSWQLDGAYVSKDQHKGAVLRNFNKVYVNATDAESKNGIVWASKPKFPFSFLFTRKNYHVADLNFYYIILQIDTFS